MNNLSRKIRKKTTTLYRYQPPAASLSNTTDRETDPTNTTITVLTTVSGPVLFSRQFGQLKRG